MKILVSGHRFLVPVAKVLSKKFDMICLEKLGAETLNNIDVECKALGDFANIVLAEEAFLEAAKVLNATFSPMSFDGLGSGPSKYLEEQVRAFLYPKLADLALLVLSLDEAKPDLVILHNDVENVARTVALWCQKRGVPFLHVPHAVYTKVTDGEVGTDIHDIVTASHLVVSGKFQHDWYKMRGQENIRETGLPQFDGWAGIQQDKRRALRLLQLDSSRPVISYMATWRQNTNLLGYNDEWADQFVTFLNAVNMFNDEIQLVVKIHPNSQEYGPQAHADILRNMGMNCVLMVQHHLVVALQAADVVFAPYGSNTLIEAAHLPHVRLMTSGGGRAFLDDDVIIKAGSNMREIAASIERALSAPPLDTTAFRAKYVGISDGKAHLRVAGYAEEIVMM